MSAGQNKIATRWLLSLKSLKLHMEIFKDRQLETINSSSARELTSLKSSKA